MVEAQLEQQEATKAKLVAPKACNNRKCCGKYCLYAEVENERIVLPLTKVEVKAELRGATADTCVELTYINPSTESPLECTYTFPIEKTSVLASFEAAFDDKVVVTKVQDKEQAQEKYDDAVAAGNAAVIAERKKKDETLTVKLGNLLPGQRAVLKMQVVSQLEIVGGQYAFILPMAFYPDYKKHGVKEAGAFVYEFAYETRIVSSSPISNVSVPTNAAIAEKSEDRTLITVRSSQPSRTIDLFFRTRDMMVPQLQYAKIEGSDKVAVSASLIPTFDQVQPQDVFDVVEDEKPEQQKLAQGNEFHFIFIVDRSGSMGFQGNRMGLAKEALELFLRSLPKGSTFSIISFGSNFDALQHNGSSIMVLSDESRDFAIAEIKEFEANYGGTNILEPLEAAQVNESYNSGLKKRVFLLTDGSVGGPQQVIDKAREHNSKVRVFSFGIGDGCDVNLVTNSARAGRGTYTLVKDGDPNLNGLVIRALGSAMEPSLCETVYGFNGALSQAEEIYRNSMVFATTLMTQEAFEQLKFNFSTKEQPDEAGSTQQALSLEFTKNDFKQVEGMAAQALFKVAAFNEIEKLEPEKQKELSLKYQVLCDQTAIVGVMKQTNQATGELQESVIKFGKESMPAESHRMMALGGFGGGGGGGSRMMKKCKRAAPMARGGALRSRAAPAMAMKRSASPEMMMMAKSAAPESSDEEDEEEEEKNAEQEDDEDDCDSFKVSEAPQMLEMKSMAQAAPMMAPPMMATAMQAPPQAPPTQPPVATQEKKLPNFTTVLQGQSSEGNWTCASRATLASCIDADCADDADVLQALGAMTLQGDQESIYLTLLAWYILEECFADYEDEWTLIVANAKAFLEAAGVVKPAQLVKKFSLSLRE